MQGRVYGVPLKSYNLSVLKKSPNLHLCPITREIACRKSEFWGETVVGSGSVFNIYLGIKTYYLVDNITMQERAANLYKFDVNMVAHFKDLQTIQSK